MALEIRIISAGSQGKSTWELLQGEEVIAQAPQNYRSLKNCRASVDRFKEAMRIKFDVRQIDP